MIDGRRPGVVGRPTPTRGRSGRLTASMPTGGAVKGGATLPAPCQVLAETRFRFMRWSSGKVRVGSRFILIFCM